MTDSGRDGTSDFGFQDIPTAEKAPRVRRIFDSVAGRYDLMNDLMSLGIHRLWKAALLDWLAPRPGALLLDVAGGTGDIALLYRRRGGGPAIVCDINPTMLTAGRRRRAMAGNDGILWLAGDAEALPVADAAVDAVTIAFGLRNVTGIDAALREARRVLRPGGRFLCLEFSRFQVGALAGAYEAWSFRIVPMLGARVAGDRAAYRYLVESIRRFPDQESLAERIAAAGLERVRWRDLSGGIAALHSAWRL